MLGSAKPRAATYADLLRLPENVVGEIVDGELIVSPRPAPRHALAASTLGVELGPFSRNRGGGPGGWIILDEPELHLDRHVLVPDLAGWRRERMPALPETPWFAIVPDWVCEILSPSTAVADRTRKQEIYREQGVSWLWFVEPTTRTIEVFHRAEGHWIMAGAFGGDGEACMPPFEAVPVDIGALWEGPAPSPPAIDPLP